MELLNHVTCYLEANQRHGKRNLKDKGTFGKEEEQEVQKLMLYSSELKQDFYQTCGCRDAGLGITSILQKVKRSTAKLEANANTMQIPSKPMKNEEEEG